MSHSRQRECATVTRVNATEPATSTRADASKRRSALVEPLYTVVEVAEMWRVTRQHVYNLIRRKQLRVVDTGSVGRTKTRIPESALVEFIEHRTTEAKTTRRRKSAA